MLQAADGPGGVENPGDGGFAVVYLGGAYYLIPNGNAVGHGADPATVVWDRQSQPFGAPHVLTADAGTDSLLRFPGQREAALTDLHYNYHRDYDPALGRYLQPDPIGLAGGDTNLYAYVGGDPVNGIDPDGQLIQLFTPDTYVDLAFIGYDIYRLFADNVFGSCGNLSENVLALGADVAGVLIPGATGLGLGVRAGGKLAKAGRRTPDVIAVDKKGNAIPLKKGEYLTGSSDGNWIQVRDSKGKATGVRIDGPHNPLKHSDPRSLQPHGHVPGRTNPDGTPWLPIRQ